ncbi:MAG: Ig-like domain-containing protein [Cytophagaceae bacterium]|nr:Ig-like domain-containing protein [Gemmatimonadaceae bacterium]
MTSQPSLRLAALALLVATAACGDDVSVAPPPATPAVRSVSIAPLTAQIRPGENLIMVYNVDADSAADRSVTWASADPRHATVSANGIVTGVAEGYSVITATSRARAELKASATIQVLPAPTVRTVTITPALLTMRSGQSVPLVASVAADSGADRTVIWASADPSRVSVSATGVVTGLAEGTAVVTATSRQRPEIAGTTAITVLPSASVRSIAVTPATVELTTSAQQPLAVTVQADDGVSRAVSFASNNTAVATVSAAGVITAVSPGSTTITVAAVASPGVTATVIVTVRAPAPPRVSIQSVTQGATNIPVNLASVAGQVEVTINVEEGQDPLARVDLVVTQGGKDTVVASQSFSVIAARGVAARSAPSALVLSFRTDQFTPATGAVALPNGAALLRAIARSVATPAGTPTSASNTVSLSLANVDGFYVTTRSLSSTSIDRAQDAQGREWVQAGRGLVVMSVPVSYTGRGVGTRTIAFPGNAPVATVVSMKVGIAEDTVMLPGYSASSTGPLYVSGELPAMTGVSPQGLTLTLVGTPATPGAGILNAQPTLVAGSPLAGVRVDNAGPPPGATFVISTSVSNSNNWVNGTYAFSSGLTGIVPDPGVGLIGTNTAPTASTVAAQYRVTGNGSADTSVVQTGSGLTPSNTHLAYAAQARYTDRLGNIRNVPLTGAVPNPLSTFGVDVQAPTARYLTTPPPGTAVISTSSDSVYTALSAFGSTYAYGVEAIDDRAGFGATPVEVSLVRVAQPNPPGQLTGTSTCVVGTVTAGVCTASAAALGATLIDGFRQLTTTLDNGTGIEGYYTYAVLVRDQAGNASGTLRKNVLYDQGTGASAPQISTIGVQAQLRGNQPAQFQPLGADNVELVKGQLYIGYPNLPTTPILAYEGGATGTFDIGTAFDGQLTSPLLGGAGFTIPLFIRAIEITDALDAPQPYAATTVKPNAVNAVLRDVPNLVPATLATNIAILPLMVETPGGTPGFINLTGSKALLKWRRFAGGTSPLRMEAVGPSGQTESPFARVILARLVPGVGPNAQVWRVLTEVTTAAVQDNGLERVWRYDLGGQSSGSYIVIGVSADGDAISSQVIVI